MTRRDWIDRLFREYSGDLFRYLRQFRLSEDETFDLVQNTFLKLLDVKQGSLKSPKSWLFTVGRNLALNELKKNKRTVNTETMDDKVDESPGALNDMINNEQNSDLYLAFTRLQESEQEILRLSIKHGLKNSEIATILGKKEGAIRVALHRAKQHLKELVQAMAA